MLTTTNSVNKLFCYDMISYSQGNRFRRLRLFQSFQVVFFQVVFSSNIVCPCLIFFLMSHVELKKRPCPMSLQFLVPVACHCKPYVACGIEKMPMSPCRF